MQWFRQRKTRKKSYLLLLEYRKISQGQRACDITQSGISIDFWYPAELQILVSISFLEDVP